MIKIKSTVNNILSIKYCYLHLYFFGNFIYIFIFIMYYVDNFF